MHFRCFAIFTTFQKVFCQNYSNIKGISAFLTPKIDPTGSVYLDYQLTTATGMLTVLVFAGMLLRMFVLLYDTEVVEEEAFLRWKEDVSEKHPGKGKALFQVLTPVICRENYAELRIAHATQLHFHISSTFFNASLATA